MNEKSPLPGTETPDKVVESTAIPWKLAGLLLVAGLVAVFVVQNVHGVEMKFLGWTFELPLIGAVIVSLGLGVLFDRAFIWWRRRRKNSQTGK